jgi:hypothetical protein
LARAALLGAADVVMLSPTAWAARAQLVISGAPVRRTAEMT